MMPFSSPVLDYVGAALVKVWPILFFTGVFSCIKVVIRREQCTLKRCGLGIATGLSLGTLCGFIAHEAGSGVWLSSGVASACALFSTSIIDIGFSVADYYREHPEEFRRSLNRKEK